MEDQYGMADLRQLVTGRPHFPDIQLASDLFSGHNQYEMLMMGHNLVGEVMHPHGFSSDYSTLPGPDIAAATEGEACNATPAGDTAGAPASMEGFLAGDGGTGRWPRQETLALLAIRTRMDHSFKEANQKGPLWEDLSRALIKEYGYHRHPKKCREKFENLYKYYKKTKEGKAGRQDGKHYRFFRQLEALNGETSGIGASDARVSSTNNQFHHASAINRTNVTALPHTQSSISQSTSSEFDSSSSEEDDLNDNVHNYETDKTNKRKQRVCWKTKIKEFIDTQMKRLIEKQDAWLEKILQTIEEKEVERAAKEKEWRKRESERIAEENRLRACDRDWLKTKIMEALKNINTKREMIPSNSDELLMSEHQQGENVSENLKSGSNSELWPEDYISKLIQLRSNNQSGFEKNNLEEKDVEKEDDDENNNNNTLWGHIAEDMGEGNSFVSGDKWSRIQSFPNKAIKTEEHPIQCSVVNRSSEELGRMQAEERSPTYSNSNYEGSLENHRVKFINMGKHY